MIQFIYFSFKCCEDKNLSQKRKEFKENTDEIKEVYKFNLAESKSNLNKTEYNNILKINKKVKSNLMQIHKKIDILNLKIVKITEKIENDIDSN